MTPPYDGLLDKSKFDAVGFEHNQDALVFARVRNESAVGPPRQIEILGYLLMRSFNGYTLLQSSVNLSDEKSKKLLVGVDR